MIGKSAEWLRTLLEQAGYFAGAFQGGGRRLDEIGPTIEPHGRLTLAR